MKIEINKKYKTRDGETVKILTVSDGYFHGKLISGTPSPYEWLLMWNLNGRYNTKSLQHPLDLIEEVCEFEVGKTYLTYNGDKVLITYIEGSPSCHWRIKGKLNGMSHSAYQWTINGTFSLSEHTNSRDLIFPPKEFVENTPEKLVIKVGKFYKTRDGFKVTIYKTDARGEHSIHGNISYDSDDMPFSWQSDGTVYSNSVNESHDIISEWGEPEELPIVDWDKLPIWADCVSKTVEGEWYWYASITDNSSICGLIPKEYEPVYKGTWDRSKIVYKDKTKHL